MRLEAGCMSWVWTLRHQDRAIAEFPLHVEDGQARFRWIDA
ncbi:hypothetical protein [Glycomyces sp. NRRL B-16210]|nr:hypothetical protein [Glycomyces sp. NRRL B-16210]